MRITEIKSHVLQYPLEEELGYSQQYYTLRTAHIVEVSTDEGITGWGECFGGGNVAFANQTIVEKVIQPMLIGMDPLDRELIWHNVYNILRDHGQKGMPIQSLSGVDIALWDIAGKTFGLPVYQLLGGAFRQTVPVYGYGMMLQRVPDLAERFKAESAAIVEEGFTAVKMKIGIGPKGDIGLVEAVREGVGPDVKLMVDANHAYTAREAIPLGRELEKLDVYWFEEPVTSEDHQGYRDLCLALDMNIAGGEGEFTRWGFRDLIGEPVCRRSAARGLRPWRYYRIPEGTGPGARPFHPGGEPCLGLCRRRRHQSPPAGGPAGFARRRPSGAADARV